MEFEEKILEFLKSLEENQKNFHNVVVKNIIWEVHRALKNLLGEKEPEARKVFAEKALDQLKSYYVVIKFVSSRPYRELSSLFERIEDYLVTFIKSMR